MYEIHNIYFNMRTIIILFTKANISKPSVKVRAGESSSGLFLKCTELILPIKNVCLIHIIISAQQGCRKVLLMLIYHRCNLTIHKTTEMDCPPEFIPKEKSQETFLADPIFLSPTIHHLTLQNCWGGGSGN